MSIPHGLPHPTLRVRDLDAPVASPAARRTAAVGVRTRARSRTATAVGALLLPSVVACLPPRPAASSRPPITRTLLSARPIDALPGWETRLYLIEYAPGASAPRHRHPYVGLGYVVSGRFESAFGDDPVAVVTAGGSFVDLARVEHRVFRNPDAREPLRFLVAYSIPVGVPTLTP